MSGPLSALIAGAGLMGRWHGQAIRRAGSRVAAVCDVDARAAGVLAGRHAARSGSDLAALIEATRPDIVHVCAPASTHRALVETALEAGVHVLVEKPLAESREETAALLQQAQRAERFLCPVHQLGFQRWISSVRDVGEPVLLDYASCSAGGAGRAEAELDRIVDEILPHPLSLFEKLRPGCLGLAQWFAARPRAGELVAEATAGGLALRISISLTGRPPRHELVVTGARGTLHADLFHGFGVVEGAHTSRRFKAARPLLLHARSLSVAAENLARRALRREYAYPGLTALIRCVHRGIREGRPVPLSAEHTLAVASARDHLRAPASASGPAG